MTKDRRRVEFFQRLCLFVIMCKMRGIDLLPISFYRSPEEQEKKFLRGLSRADGFVVKSPHQLWQAMDLPVVDWNDDGTARLVWNTKDPRYHEMYEIAKRCGLETGYEWRKPKDPTHVQLPKHV